MAWVVPAVMGATTIAQMISQGQQAGAARKREAEIAKFSPWTGMQASGVDDPNQIGTLAGGAASAFSQYKAGQAADEASKMSKANQELSNKLTESQIGALDRLSGKPANAAPPAIPMAPPSSGEYGGGSAGAMGAKPSLMGAEGFQMGNDPYLELLKKMQMQKGI